MSTRTIKAIACQCERCGYQWIAKEAVPVRCAGCGSVYWNRPRRIKKIVGEAK